MDPLTYKVTELKEMARQKGLKGYSRLNKPQLVHLLFPPAPVPLQPRGPKVYQSIDLVFRVDRPTPQQEGRNALFHIRGIEQIMSVPEFEEFLQSAGYNTQHQQFEDFEEGDIVRLNQNSYDSSRNQYVFDNNGVLSVVNINERFYLPEEAWPFLEEKRVQTLEDLYNLYGLQPEWKSELRFDGVILNGQPFDLPDPDDTIFNQLYENI